MAHRDDPAPFRASLGTVFLNDEVEDVVLIATQDGAEFHIPGPDLREYVERLLADGHSAPDQGYAGILDRARLDLVDLESRVRYEEQQAASSLAELLAAPRAERPRSIDSEARYRTYSLASVATERALDMVHEDPLLALELAEVACGVAAALDTRRYGPAHVRDLQAHAAAVRGNALRVLGDLKTARRAFVEAREFLSLGTTEPPEALEVDRLESSLLRDLRDFRGALALLDGVHQGYLGLGETEAAARALYQKGILLDETGQPEAAIEVLGEAAKLAANCGNGLLDLHIRHSLTICLARAGRTEQAAELFASLQGLYRAHFTPLLEARRTWAQGLIELEAGNPAGVVAPLTRARGIFESNGYVFDTALVSLDLAAALAGLGRIVEVRDLAAATYAVLESREVHPDALAALAVFQQAAARERVTRELLRDVARRLDEASSRRPTVS